MSVIQAILSSVSNALTIAASGIAIYVFVTKRKQLAYAISVLVNYSHQLTLSELKEKLERLNEYNAREDGGIDKIIDILNEILGQIKGNEKLSKELAGIVETIEAMTRDHTRLSEPRKRAIVGELRERLRSIDIRGFNEAVTKNGYE